MPDRLDNRIRGETEYTQAKMRPKLEITRRREETWLAAMDSGMTTAAIAEASGVTPQYVRRLVKAARQARDPDQAEPASSLATTTPTPTACELPRLVLTDGPTLGTTQPRKPDGLVYSLATDSVSLDGGSTWIPADSPDTPRLPVLVSDRNGRGLRKHRLEPRPFQQPPDPSKIGGLPANSDLKGGCG